MAYGQWPGQDGQQEWPDDDGRSLPPWRSAQQGDTQRFGPYGQPGYDERGQQAGGDGRWQPPEWRYGQQRHEQGNGQRGYAPGQYQPQFQPAPPSQPGQRGFGPPVPQPPYGPPQPPQSPYRPPQSPYGPPQPPRGKSWPARHKVLTGVFGFAALITIIAVANSGGSASSSSGTAVGNQSTASAPAAAPPMKAASHTQAAASAQTITYEVTGSAAAVTYGPAGSSLSGAVPMHATAKLGDPVFYSLQAQLQGGGSVTVKILVNGKVISQSTATGGYNIASAEISQDPLSGQWADTNQA